MAKTAAPRGRLIVFEGIDGSGKTTVSNCVAEALEARGLRVVHVRAGGKLASATAERIREVARDPRNLRLAPFAELLLYVARETQQLEERIRPALAEADVVIADRFFHTAQVLAGHGRGLPAARIQPVLDAATSGLEPHLSVLVDVDPHVAGARRRADKIARPELRSGSRKGLAGASLMHRLRRGYLEVAAAAPAEWLIAENTEADLALLVDRLVVAIVAALAHTPARWQADDAAPALTPARIDARPEATRLRSGRQSGSSRQLFLSWIDDRLLGEPEVAAYMLGGCAGPGFDERRLRASRLAGDVVAAGLRGLDDQVSWSLRRALAAEHPRQVACSLVGAAGEPAWALRRQLVGYAPAELAESLEGLATDESWQLRSRLWELAPAGVLASLAGLGSRAAWLLRESWLRALGGEDALDVPEHARAMCASLRGLACARAWTLRRRARDASPVGAILSLRELGDERSWRWRARWIDCAPRAVLATIHGVDDERAWALRGATWPGAKEAIDSIAALDGERAWRLRELAASRHPSTVAKSLIGLGGGRRDAHALVERLRREHPHDVALLRHAARLEPEPLARRVSLG